jgi:hypothetical protein
LTSGKYTRLYDSISTLCIHVHPALTPRLTRLPDGRLQFETQDRAIPGNIFLDLANMVEYLRAAPLLGLVTGQAVEPGSPRLLPALICRRAADAAAVPLSAQGR